MFELPVDEDIRLVLRDPNEAEALFSLIDRNRGHLRPWFNWVDTTQSVDTTRKYLEMCVQGFEAGTLVDLGIRYRDEWVGSLSLHAIEKASSKAEIGYWVAQDHQGKGIVTRAVRALIEYGFGSLNLNRVAILCNVSNQASAEVARRLKFHHEGTLRQYECVNGELVDYHIFSRLKSD